MDFIEPGDIQWPVTNLRESYLEFPCNYSTVSQDHGREMNGFSGDNSTLNNQRRAPRSITASLCPFSTACKSVHSQPWQCFDNISFIAFISPTAGAHHRRTKQFASRNVLNSREALATAVANKGRHKFGKRGTRNLLKEGVAADCLYYNGSNWLADHRLRG